MRKALFAGITGVVGMITFAVPVQAAAIPKPPDDAQWECDGDPMPVSIHGRHVTVVTSTYQIASWGYSVQAPDGTVTTTFKRYGGKQQTQEIFGCSTTVGNETWHLSNR
jgi:hypothetical protein